MLDIIRQQLLALSQDPTRLKKIAIVRRLFDAISAAQESGVRQEIIHQVLVTEAGYTGSCDTFRSDLSRVRRQRAATQKIQTPSPVPSVVKSPAIIPDFGEPVLSIRQRSNAVADEFMKKHAQTIDPKLQRIIDQLAKQKQERS